MAAKMLVLGLLLSSYPNLRSAMVRFSSTQNGWTVQSGGVSRGRVWHQLGYSVLFQSKIVTFLFRAV